MGFGTTDKTEIQEILKKDPSATVAVLLRSNFAINKWDSLLKENLIKTYKNSDSLINNPLYRITLLISFLDFSLLV